MNQDTPASDLKIFQIGFNKCATRSISHFFKLHGLAVADWKHGALAVSIRDALANGTRPLAEWPEVNVFTDMEQTKARDLIEGYRYFRELDAAYPGARFILNTRDMDTWIRSRHAHGAGAYTSAYRRAFGLADDEAVFEHWRNDWTTHHRDVLEYFSGDDSAKLLVWDIAAPDFPAIERFVGFPLDSLKWPVRGKTEGLQQEKRP